MEDLKRLGRFPHAVHKTSRMIIDDKLLDKLQQGARASERLRVHLDLRDDAGEESQRMLNVMEPGTAVPVHRHVDTAETVIILRGRMDEIYYDGLGNETKRFHLDASRGVYGLQIPAGQYHSVEALTPCAIIEIKAGRYDPVKTEDLLAAHV